MARNLITWKNSRIVWRILKWRCGQEVGTLEINVVFVACCLLQLPVQFVFVNLAGRIPTTMILRHYIWTDILIINIHVYGRRYQVYSKYTLMGHQFFLGEMFWKKISVTNNNIYNIYMYVPEIMYSLWKETLLLAESKHIQFFYKPDFHKKTHLM